MKIQSNNINSEFIFVRRVLIEKNSLELRAKWAQAQKNKVVRNQNYEMAATFREIERFYTVSGCFHEHDEERISKMYFKLFEEYDEQ